METNSRLPIATTLMNKNLYTKYSTIIYKVSMRRIIESVKVKNFVKAPFSLYVMKSSNCLISIYMYTKEDI